MKDITLTIYPRSLGTDTSGREHKALRDAVDAASVSGETTYLCNSAGARIARIAPLDGASDQSERPAPAVAPVNVHRLAGLLHDIAVAAAGRTVRQPVRSRAWIEAYLRGEE